MTYPGHVYGFACVLCQQSCIDAQDVQNFQSVLTAKFCKDPIQALHQNDQVSSTVCCIHDSGPMISRHRNFMVSTSTRV